MLPIRRIHSKARPARALRSSPRSLSLRLQGGGRATYMLYAAIIHAGQSANHGHYYTLGVGSRIALRNRPAAGVRCPWLELDDSSVRNIDGAASSLATSRAPAAAPAARARRAPARVEPLDPLYMLYTFPY